MSPIHRDPDDEPIFAPTYERLVERLIREAQERGELDARAAHGRPLTLDENAYAGDMGLAFTMLRNAGVPPPWIAADKDVRELLERRDGIVERARLAAARGDATPALIASLRRELTEVVRAHALAVERLNAEAPTDRQHRRRLKLEDELASLDAFEP